MPPSKQRRWYLGIQSKKAPSAVMTEVYRALQQLHCSWVVRARYQVTIRWPAAPSEVDAAVVDPSLVAALQGMPRVQLGLQLYKVHSNISLLDFQVR